MYAKSLYVALLAALASNPLMVTAIPVPEPLEADSAAVSNGNVTARPVIGFHKAGISKRSSTPIACQFPTGHDTDYYYSDQSAEAGHPNCVGWAKVVGCPAYSSQKLSDGESCMTQQITKDGQFKTTTVGGWTAGFGALTTAFSYTNPVNFDHVFGAAQGGSYGSEAVGAGTWYYMDQANFIQMETTSCS